MLAARALEKMAVCGSKVRPDTGLGSPGCGPRAPTGPTRAMFFTAGVLALERRALRIAVSPWAKVFRPWRHPSMRKNGARWGPRWRDLKTHSQEWLCHPNPEAKMPG